MLRVLLFDRETAQRAELRNILQSMPGVSVVGEAASVSSAIGMLAGTPCDLVFLAIEFDDGCGFQLTNVIRGGARAVFIAPDGLHALRGFEVNALDFLVTPLQPARVAGAVARLQGAPISINESTAPFPLKLGMSDRLQIEWGGGRVATVSELRVIVAQENYSIVHLGNGAKAIVRRSLKAWLDVLPPAHFRRVHRSWIVSLTKVTGVKRVGPKSHLLRVDGVIERVPVGRASWRDLRSCLPARAREI